jgi:hypothetical protein
MDGLRVLDPQFEGGKVEPKSGSRINPGDAYVTSNATVDMSSVTCKSNNPRCRRRLLICSKFLGHGECYPVQALQPIRECGDYVANQ